jgi:hypothetical protein
VFIFQGVSQVLGSHHWCCRTSSCWRTCKGNSWALENVEVKTYLGMINCYQKFLPNLGQVSNLWKVDWDKLFIGLECKVSKSFWSQLEEIVKSPTIGSLWSQ